MIIHDDGVGGCRPAPWAWEPLKQYKYYDCRLQIFGYKEYKRYIHLDIFNQSTQWSLFMQTLNHGLFIIPAYEPQHTLPPQSPVLAKRSNPMNIWCCISVFAEDARNYWIFDADAGLARMQGSGVHMLLLWDQWTLVTCVPSTRVMIMSMDIVLGWRTAV